MEKPILYIIVPCYNEQDVLLETSYVLNEKLISLINNSIINAKSKIVFVNDGSVDNTWNYIKKLADDNEHIEGIALSRNRGHQNACLAGLLESIDYYDISITIDADGQDDINAIDEMINKYQDGNDIVYGVRSNRDTDSFLKKFTAETYYKILLLLGVNVVYNHADYRLISKKAMKELSKFNEVNLFLRGMIPLIGFNSTKVFYKREKRIAGKSHYDISKMFNLAIDGITSLSIEPIKLIFIGGLFIALISFILIIVFSFIGSALLICSSVICFVLGIQIIAIGIVGTYVGKTYLETKARPRYIVSKRTWIND